VEQTDFFIQVCDFVVPKRTTYGNKYIENIIITIYYKYILKRHKKFLVRIIKDG